MIWANKTSLLFIFNVYCILFATSLLLVGSQKNDFAWTCNVIVWRSMVMVGVCCDDSAGIIHPYPGSASLLLLWAVPETLGVVLSEGKATEHQQFILVAGGDEDVIWNGCGLNYSSEKIFLFMILNNRTNEPKGPCEPKDCQVWIYLFIYTFSYISQTIYFKFII